MEALLSDPKEESLAAGDGDHGIYEDIEAPKYVDFTAPDRSKPDGASWFCDRVGCDRTHEEVDPDSIYRSFLLRVMAARSPNVRLRKAWDRPGQSLIPKCPHSAPAKSAKDRAIRFSRITSIPEKMANNKLKDYNILSLRSTPKVRPPITEKSFTTPRNKNCLSRHEPFRSVKHRKVPAEVPKKSTVAKALFHQTPQKASEADRVPLSRHTPVSEVCQEMKKLKIGTINKHGPKGQSCKAPRRAAYNSSGLQPSSLPEKSNFHSVDAQKGGDEAAMDAKDRLQTSDSTIHEESPHNHLSNMEIDKNEANLSACAIEEQGQSPMESDVKESIATVLEDHTSLKNSEAMQNTNTDLEEKVLEQPNSVVAGAENKIKEDAFDADDDKENASDACQTSSVTTNVTNSESVSTQIENFENIHRKAISQPSKAELHERIVHGGKYKKTKPTCPKPFRLRTDERGILKEANMERRLQLEARKEILPVAKPKEGTQKNISNEHDSQIDSNIRLKKAKPTQIKAARKKLAKFAEIKATSNPQSKKSDTSKDKTAEKFPKRIINVKPSSAVTARDLPASQLGRQKGPSTPIKEEREENTSSARTPFSRGLRSSTLPKEPKFHRIHVPKSCIKRPEMTTS